MAEDHTPTMTAARSNRRPGHVLLLVTSFIIAIIALTGALTYGCGDNEVAQLDCPPGYFAVGECCLEERFRVYIDFEGEWGGVGCCYECQSYPTATSCVEDPVSGVLLWNTGNCQQMTNTACVDVRCP